MTAKEAIEIIKREMLAQSINHRKSAVKRVNSYRLNEKGASLFECMRLELTAEALLGVSKALTIEKVKEWREKQSIIAGEI